MLRTFVKSIFSRLGYTLVKGTPRAASPYPAMILGLLSLVEGRARIVVVGANDGSINDPIYKTAMEQRERTEVLLVEPQIALLPYLRESYEDHPRATIFNGAIGDPGTLTLYAIDPSFWNKLSVPYARSWPPYRAPTGITSSDRERVEAWARMHLRAGEYSSAVVKEIIVPAKTLVEAMTSSGFGDAPIDVLQIDAEGFDDHVIHHSNIETLSPILIRFERDGLSKSRSEALLDFLSQLGYFVFNDAEDSIAVKWRPR